MPTKVAFDLHVHSTVSPDSQLAPEEAVRRGAKLGLRGIAITDHNRVSGVAKTEAAAQTQPGFLVIPGVEISTAEGHLLAYGIREAPPSRAPLLDTIEIVHRLGGVAVLAHPFRWAHGAGRRWAERAPVDGIETLNGRNSAGVNAKATEVASRRRLPSTGGSDAHDVAALGRATTEFDLDVTSVEQVLEELRLGRVHPAGQGQSVAGRVRLSLNNAGKRTSRGFRPV